MKRSPVIVNTVLGVTLAVAVAGSVVAVRGSQSEPVTTEQTATVTRGDVVASVSASGNLTASTQVDADFAGAAGIVTDIFVQEGERVRAGDRLARIDDTAARQQLAAAESTLAQALSGRSTAGSSVTSAQQQLTLAQATAEASNTSLSQAVVQAQSNLDAAISQWADACTDPDNPECPNPAAAEAIRTAENNVTTARLNVDAATASAVSNAAKYDMQVNQALATVTQARSVKQTTCDNAGSESTACVSAGSSVLSAEQAYDTAVSNRTAGTLSDNQNVEKQTMALSNAQVALRKTQADLRKSSQDAIRSAKQALTNAKAARDKGRIANDQTIQNARSTLTQAQAAVATFGTDDDGRALAQADASVAAARAQVKVAERAVADTVLRAPVDGTISAISGTVGQTSNVTGATSGTSGSSSGFAVISNLQQLQVTSRVAEADAGNIRLGQVATVTFPAVGVTANGVVTAIDVLDTVTNNVVEYGVTVSLLDPPKGLKIGQTASVSIVTAEAVDVLTLPASAVTRVGGTATVSVRSPDGTTSPVTVQTGLEGGDRVEILSGLDDGAVVVLPTTGGIPAGFTFPAGGVGGGLGGGLGG